MYRSLLIATVFGFLVFATGCESDKTSSARSEEPKGSSPKASGPEAPPPTPPPIIKK